MRKVLAMFLIVAVGATLYWAGGLYGQQDKKFSPEDPYPLTRLEYLALWLTAYYRPEQNDSETITSVYFAIPPETIRVMVRYTGDEDPLKSSVLAKFYGKRTESTARDFGIEVKAKVEVEKRTYPTVRVKKIDGE